MNLSGQKETVRPETKMAFKPEYVGCFSLCPEYSNRQLRRINDLTHKYYHGKRNPFTFGFYRNVPPLTQKQVKHAFSQETYKETFTTIPSRGKKVKPLEVKGL
jgi:hypothetical protein